MNEETEVDSSEVVELKYKFLYVVYLCFSLIREFGDAWKEPFIPSANISWESSMCLAFF